MFETCRCSLQEGKLRVFQYDASHDKSCSGTNFFSDDSFDEVEQYPCLW